MFSRMNMSYFWQPTGLKVCATVNGVIRNRSRATGAGAGVACHMRSNAVC